MKAARRFVGVVLLGVAGAAAVPASGQETTARIIGVVHEVAPQAGVLFVGEGVSGTGGPRAILLCPDTRVLQLIRDRTHRITNQPASVERIRRGDFVDVTAARHGDRLRAIEIRISPESGS